MQVANIFKHLKLVTKHRWIVFKLCCKIGLPWRGLVHDLSKYSPTEFFESAKYYVGNGSPIVVARKEKGYSEAWLHHKGRNKHHEEYWVDENAPIKLALIPYKYAAEMLCDKMAAGIIYKGKDWTREYELSYWEKEKEYKKVNSKIKEFFTDVLEQVAMEGIDKTFTKKNFKEKYQKHCGV